MPKLIAFHKLGANRDTPRVWLESQRLNASGFEPGTPFQVIPSAGRLSITRLESGKRAVSHRKAAGGLRPIIELCSAELDRFAGIETVKAKASYGRIDITASLRAFLIGKSRKTAPPFRTLEIFAGGGTLSEALKDNPLFQLTTGVEIEPAFADAWGARHPEATMFQADIRAIHPAELPRFDVLVGGIPCTSHSTMGRAKKSLAGKPEEGDTGDLFLHALQIAAHHMPAACVFENVPNFGASLAGSLLKTSLSHLGYELHEHILEPHECWNEPSDRRRWALIATLHPGFCIAAPNTPFTGDLSAFLDPEMPEQDKEDALRIANTVEGLHRHNARHAALGHGFALTTINRGSRKVPTIPKSYHKINTGPFVETSFGLRMLRLNEVEAIMGAPAGVEHYSTGIQILGQGVQTRIWRSVLAQLGTFLENPGCQEIREELHDGQLDFRLA